LDQQRCFVHEYEITYTRLFTHCNTLQHTATHCNTLQHTATQKLCRLCTWRYLFGSATMFSTCRGHAWLSSGSISQKSAEIFQSQYHKSSQNFSREFLQTRLAIVRFNFSKVNFSKVRRNSPKPIAHQSAKILRTTSADTLGYRQIEYLQSILIQSLQV